MRQHLYLKLLLISFLFISCIKNDIPYPQVIANIVSFDVKGQISSKIDTDLRTVKLELADTVDLSKVTLLKMEVSNNAIVTPEPQSRIDLSSILEYTLSTYQDYIWTISATQQIERYFEVENQIGESLIDIENHKIIFSIPDTQSLTEVKVLRVKLGPSGSIILPEIMGITNFSNEVKITNIHNERAEIWTIYGTKTKVSFSTSNNVDAYAKYAKVEGSGESGKTSYTFDYKKKTDTQWQSISSSDIQFSGATFKATINNLEPLTEYIVRAVDGSNFANEVTFTTEGTSQLTNMNFDSWIKTGKHWYPNSTSDKQNSNYIWDCGNIGANTLSEVNPTSPTSTVAVAGEGKQAARLESKAVFGILAAGSIYTGQFGKTIGTSGAEIYFGRPYTCRPKSLKGYYNYAPVTINKSKSPYEHLMGQPDIYNIYVLLADWSTWFTVNTAAGKFVDFDDPSIIAYGAVEGNTNSDGFKEFNIPLEYRNTKKPTHCLIVCSASKYGDYFTGGVGSVLIVDEFEFVF